MILKKVNKLEAPLPQAYNVTGENGIGWSDEEGDFKRIKIKLKNYHEILYDNSSGWLDIFKKGNYSSGSVSDWIKTPEQSEKIHKHLYGITLDMVQGDQILMFFGYQYSTDSARLLTLIYIGQDQAEMIFSKHCTLFEIREEVQGYSLIGRIDSEDSYSDPYEIAIKDGRLAFEKLPLQKVYESKDPHIILHNSIGWSENSQPGEFTRLEIAAPARNKDQKPGIQC